MIATRIAKLAMVRMIPEFFLDKVPPGRLHGRLLKLQNEVDSMLSRMPPPTPEQNRAIYKIVSNFGYLSGWEGKERHIITVISFVMALVNDEKWDKINDLLVDIHDYYERVGDTNQLCYIGGNIAAEKWGYAYE